MEWPAFQLIHADRERKRCVGQNCDRERERERASHDNVCVYPRDDVNTPHESTRLLGRGGRAAQFSCSRSSLVTRRNSAQVVLLCGECSTAASTYDLSLPPCLSLFLFSYLSALFVRFLPSRLFFFWALLHTPRFSPLFALAAFSSPSPLYLIFSFFFFADNPLLHPSFPSH